MLIYWLSGKVKWVVLLLCELMMYSSGGGWVFRVLILRLFFLSSRF